MIRRRVHLSSFVAAKVVLTKPQLAAQSLSQQPPMSPRESAVKEGLRQSHDTRMAQVPLLLLDGSSLNTQAGRLFFQEPQRRPPDPGDEHDGSAHAAS